MKKIVLLLSMGMLLFSCRPPENPSVITGEVTDITGTTAICAGDVTADGGAAIIARGVCWSTSQFPSISDSKTSNGNGLGGFTSNITGLSPGTTYYVRAYATNAAGTAYGEQNKFTTPLERPTVVTGDVTNIAATTADCSGNVTADGGVFVIDRGVCWSTDSYPLIGFDPQTTDGTGLGTYTSKITGLSPNTTYYVSAYATNFKGTGYGEIKTFTTDIGMPTVVTGDVTNRTATTADCSGNVTADGGAAVTARGVCWSTSENPSTSDSMTTDGTGVGTYTSNITGLSPKTTYYVRAYATNSEGTAYGKQKTFTTKAQMPSVTTGDVSNISTTTADCSGNVTADGGAAVTARGVCWSTSQNPTTSDSKTTDGTGVGTYTSNITGLSLNTTYYVRAYATNSVGTAYGEQRTFKTQEINPVFGSFTDSRDGNQYVTVTLGKQVWMAENLAYLPSVSKPYSGSWSSPYCYVYGYVGTSVTTAKATTNYQTYGVLYNWPAALEACPDGWHLPSDGEWTTLTDYLGGISVAADKLKEAGTTHWPSPNDATNESGFTALPGGYRFDYDSGANFEGIGYHCDWWSSTEHNAIDAWYRGLGFNASYVGRYDNNEAFGFSVRCVRD
jgi:uncharacterized protein (TIGR02145 family)